MVKSHDLKPVSGMVFRAESLSDFEIERDELGSLIGVQYAGYRTYEPYVDVCDEIAQNLVTRVSSRINHYHKTKAFDHLVIIAPLKILGAFRQQLNPPTLDCVIAEIEKDLTNDNSRVLLSHLKESFAGSHIG